MVGSSNNKGVNRNDIKMYSENHLEDRTPSNELDHSHIFSFYNSDLCSISIWDRFISLCRIHDNQVFNDKDYMRSICSINNSGGTLLMCHVYNQLSSLNAMMFIQIMNFVNVLMHGPGVKNSRFSLICKQVSYTCIHIQSCGHCRRAGSHCKG